MTHPSKQATQDEGERDRLIAILRNEKITRTAEMADAILAAGYSRRTEATPADESPGFVKPEKTERLRVQRTEAAGEARRLAEAVLDQLYDQPKPAEEAIEIIARCFTTHARAAEERAIDRCAAIIEAEIAFHPSSLVMLKHLVALVRAIRGQSAAQGDER